MAANVLSPKPRDFTDPDKARQLSDHRIFDSIKNGRNGTAMKPFKGILSDKEIESVAAFIRHAFIEKRFENIRYHSPENGWRDFEDKYPEAIQYYFYRGENERLPENLKIGKRIFESSCITCHLARIKERGIIFRKEE